MPAFANMQPAREQPEHEHARRDLEGNVRVLQAFHTEPAAQRSLSRQSFVSACEEQDEVTDQEALDSDMEGSIMERPRPKKQLNTPTVPQRSGKRAPTILDNGCEELPQIHGYSKSTTTLSSLDIASFSDPYGEYLSSEEDASISDECDASLLDFDMDGPSSVNEAGKAQSQAKSRASEEEAKLVSFQVVSRPRVIEIHHRRSVSNPTSSSTPAISSGHSSRLSLAIPAQSSAASPAHMALPTTIARESSNRSPALVSISKSEPLIHSHPARASSKFSFKPKPSAIANNDTSRTSSFSNFTASFSHNRSPSDAPPSYQLSCKASERLLAGTKALEMENMLEGKRRSTFSMGKKRPSMPRFNLSYTPGVVPPRCPAKADILHPQTSHLIVEEAQTDIAVVRRISMPGEKNNLMGKAGAVRYEDIMRSVIKEPTPPPKENAWSFARRKSVKR